MSENQSPDEMTSEDAGQVDDTLSETAPEPATGQVDEAAVEDGAPDAEGSDTDPLADAQAQIADLEDQLARSRADVYNVSQEYNAYVRRSKADGAAQKQAGVSSVLETLLPVLDEVELARQHGDLDGPAGAIASKVENTLETNYQLVRFGAVGDPFDPEIHEALMHSQSEDVESEQVGTLIQPGYKMGDRVLRPARVGVVSPQ